MRALLSDGGLRFVADRAVPSPAADESLVRVLVAGICNTDLEVERGYLGFRGVLGHEFMGLVETSPEPDLIGRRVVGEINANCGHCPTCQAGRPTHCPQRTTIGISGRDGAFADYVTLPTHLLHEIPESVPNRWAVFAEPLAAGLEILEQVHLRPTDRVAVVGDGKLGLLIAQVVALTGCELRTLGRRRRHLGILADRGIAVSLVNEALPVGDMDVVVECTGNPEGFDVARRLLRPRGTLVLKSTYHGTASVDLSSLVVDEITLVGSRCGPFAPALRLLESGRIAVEPLIDAVYPFDDAPAAFRRAAEPGTLKVLLNMD
jgi:threonine dehydrogenase-like Zn-dependent dehydrogenase